MLPDIMINIHGNLSLEEAGFLEMFTKAKISYQNPHLRFLSFLDFFGLRGM